MAVALGEDDLEGGHHRVLLDGLADLAELFLQRLGFRLLPGVEELADRRRVDVGGRRDAAGGAELQEAEEVDLGTREDRQTRQALDEVLGDVEVAARILDAHDHFRERLAEALHQRHRPADDGDRRDVVEHQLRHLRADPLDELGDEAEDALVAHLLVVEGRQEEHARGAHLAGAPRQRHGIVDGAGAGSRQELPAFDARLDMRIDHAAALVQRQRIRLAGGAEDGEAMGAVGEQALAVGNRARGIEGTVGVEGRGDGRPQARKLEGHVLHPGWKGERREHSPVARRGQSRRGLLRLAAKR